MKVPFDDIIDIFKKKYSSEQSDIDLFYLGWNECVLGWKPTIIDKSYSRFSDIVNINEFHFFLFGWNCCEAFFYNVNDMWQLFERNDKIYNHHIIEEIMKTFMERIIRDKIKLSSEMKNLISVFNKISDAVISSKKPKT